MSKKTLIPIILLSAAGLTRLHAQDFSKFNFNIGGGITTPINPTANYVGLSGNFAVGAGYNINKKNSIIAEFHVERPAAQHHSPPAQRPVRQHEPIHHHHQLPASHRSSSDTPRLAAM